MTALAAATPIGGCAGRPRPASSPEQAYQQLADACSSGDTARLFDSLDTPTQWAIETVHGAQQEMRRLIIAAYPPSERDAALLRVPAASDEDLERPRRYYRAMPDSEEALASIKQRLSLGAGQPVGPSGRAAGGDPAASADGVAEVARAGGSRLHFFRDEKGRWGYMDLREAWEHERERALHELETVKDNAALYRRRGPGTSPDPRGEKGSG